jgi:hypothetical protein
VHIKIKMYICAYYAHEFYTLIHSKNRNKKDVMQGDKLYIIKNHMTLTIYSNFINNLTIYYIKRNLLIWQKILL